MRGLREAAAVAIGGAVVGGGFYLGLVTGAVPIDLGVGRRLRELGPSSRAMQNKVRVLERGQDLVLAGHYTPIRGRLRATTVETVRFARPRQIGFRLVRGPVPYVVETFTFDPGGGHALLTYSGQLGTDLWQLGERWGDLVAAKWVSVVASALDATKTESERRHRVRRDATPRDT